MAPMAARPNGVASGSVLGPVLRFWQRSYASDYASFALLLTVYIIIQFFVEPFHRMFYVNNLNISFPHAVIERVPVYMNFVYALFTPLFLLILYNTVAGASVHKHHVSVLGILIALVMASTVTDIIKNMVGRPRPDLIARCRPAPGTPINTLVSIDVCTETDHHTLHDGWRSFPSGHSSFAFAGLGYVSLFLAGQLRIFVLSSADNMVHVRGDLGKVLVCLAPLLGAVMIAISRCQDYRHDVYDVCTGALLGWTIAYWSYRRYWPHLASPRCNEPYPGPGPARMGTGSGGSSGSGGGSSDFATYGRLRDEEEGYRED